MCGIRVPDEVVEALGRLHLTMEGRLELVLVFDASEQDGDGFSRVVLELDSRSEVSTGALHAP
jgi:hypothetical protein